MDIEFLGGGLAPALAEPGAAATSNRSSPIVGMRGGLEGPGAAAEPIRGLAAFGSHGSVQDSSSSAVPMVGRYQHHHHQHQGGVGPGGSSPMSSTNPPAPNETQGAAAGGESNGAAARRGSGTEGGGDGRERRTNSSNSAQRSGARSNSPYRGGSGVSRTPGQGASSPGELEAQGCGWFEGDAHSRPILGKEEIQPAAEDVGEIYVPLCCSSHTNVEMRRFVPNIHSVPDTREIDFFELPLVGYTYDGRRPACPLSRVL